MRHKIIQQEFAPLTIEITFELLGEVVEMWKRLNISSENIDKMTIDYPDYESGYDGIIRLGKSLKSILIRESSY